MHISGDKVPELEATVQLYGWQLSADGSGLRARGNHMKIHRKLKDHDSDWAPNMAENAFQNNQLMARSHNEYACPFYTDWDE